MDYAWAYEDVGVHVPPVQAKPVVYMFLQHRVETYTKIESKTCGIHELPPLEGTIHRILRAKPMVYHPRKPMRNLFRYTAFMMNAV